MVAVSLKNSVCKSAITLPLKLRFESRASNWHFQEPKESASGVAACWKDESKTQISPSAAIAWDFSQDLGNSSYILKLGKKTKI